MTIRKHLVYTSFHREANFYEITCNGRISAYEVSGKDLHYSGRLERSAFLRMLKEVKAKDGATYERGRKIESQPQKLRKAEPKEYSELGSTIKKINQKVKKDSYKMSVSEWEWDYLPTLYKERNQDYEVLACLL